MWEITLPKIIVAGEGASEYLERIEGRKALIVTGKTVRKVGFTDKIARHLKKAEIEVEFFEVEPEPSVETVVRGANVAKSFSPDLIIGLGGGSNMDAAKAIWVLYERPDIEVASINPFIKLGLRRKARLICIPTTSGSGSEASWATVITSPADERKLELANKELVPDIAIIDPEFPMIMPQKLVAETGFDALTHAIEAYVSPLGNDFSDALAMKAIKTIFNYLKRSYMDTQDKEAREKMHIAATMAGMAFTNSEVGIAHALGHVTGGVLHVPHGRAMAIILPYSIEYNAGVAKQKYVEIAKAVGIKARTDDEAVKKLVRKVVQLRRELELPSSFKEAGISKEEFEKKLDDLANKATKSVVLRGNPRPLSLEEAKKLFTYMYKGKSVDF
ncbi:MAG: iron-containing alcohol dehydrogenase [Candidatus Bathyarchaeia archaeon]